MSTIQIDSITLVMILGSIACVGVVILFGYIIMESDKEIDKINGMNCNELGIKIKNNDFVSSTSQYKATSLYMVNCEGKSK